MGHTKERSNTLFNMLLWTYNIDEVFDNYAIFNVKHDYTNEKYMCQINTCFVIVKIMMKTGQRVNTHFNTCSFQNI